MKLTGLQLLSGMVLTKLAAAFGFNTRSQLLDAPSEFYKDPVGDVYKPVSVIASAIEAGFYEDSRFDQDDWFVYLYRASRTARDLLRIRKRVKMDK